MRDARVVVACGDPLATNLCTRMKSQRIEPIRRVPDHVGPEILEDVAPQALVLETGLAGAEARIQSFWAGREMDQHVPILLLLPPDSNSISLPNGLLDEPLDQMVLPAPPGEALARVQTLLSMGLIRIFRQAVHDLSQPLTIARAYSRKAVKLAGPTDGVHEPLLELDRQIERIFHVVEDLQRKRAGE